MQKLIAILTRARVSRVYPHHSVSSLENALLFCGHVWAAPLPSAQKRHCDNAQTHFSVRVSLSFALTLLSQDSFWSVEPSLSGFVQEAK